MIKLSTVSSFAFSSAMLFVAVNQAHASDVAASFALPQSPCCSGLVSGVDGFDFTPKVDIVVGALGWYDHEADGLNNAHPVGLYLTATQELFSPAAMVTSASRLDPSTSFRFEQIAPVVLSANTTYTIVGFGSGPNWDLYVNSPAGGITFSPYITYNRWRTASASSLQFPTIAGEGGVTQALFFAANFVLTPIPEPSSYLLMLSGVALLLSRPKFRQRNS